MSQIAQITNPALPPSLGSGAELQDGASNGGTIIAQLVVIIWQTLLALAGILVILWFVYGGISWLTAGGSKEQVENARNRIINAVIGLAILFATFAIVNWLGPAIGFDLLQITLPGPGSFGTS